MPLAPLSPGHQRSFKARPLNKRVMESAGDLGVPRIARAAPTAVSEFKFGTSVRKEAPEKSKEVELPLYSSFAPAPVRRSNSFTPRPATAPSASKPATAKPAAAKPAAVKPTAAKPTAAKLAAAKPAVAAPQPTAAKPAASKLGSASAVASAKLRIGLLGLAEVLPRP